MDKKGLPLDQFQFKTPKKSTSFANPSISLLNDNITGEPMYAISYFMPSEGNDIGESGTVIYTIPVPK